MRTETVEAKRGGERPARGRQVAGEERAGGGRRVPRPAVRGVS